MSKMPDPLDMTCGQSRVYAIGMSRELLLSVQIEGERDLRTTIGAYLTYEQAKQLADFLYQAAERR